MATRALEVPAVTRVSFERTFVRVERRGGLVRVVLDRPPLNVLSTAMLEEVDGALAELAEDRTVKVLVLTGEGRAFCAGADVGDHLPGRVEPMLDVLHRVVRRLLACEAPTVAAVNGAALGGGCELVLACDFAVARADATLGQPEVRLGVFPPVAAALLPGLVGWRRALDLVLTGRTVDAAEAKGFGLVTDAVPAEAFDAAVESLAARLLACSGPVLRVAKRAVLEAGALPADRGIERAERIYLHDLVRLEDAGEGLLAFLEKRPPAWKEG
jgi:cyclohexa-1,5-dienecarbonyl-CoA hydratase